MLNDDSPDTPALQVKALRNGESVDKPIYNHVTGLLDPPEKTKSPHVGRPSMVKICCVQLLHISTLLPATHCSCCASPPAAQALCRCPAAPCAQGSATACDTCLLAAAPATVSSAYDEPPESPSRHTPAVHRTIARSDTADSLASRPPQSPALRTSAWELPQLLLTCLQILVIEGLHPFYDERVRDLLDFKIYLDISDDVKFAWKLQRDMAERGHSEESIKQSIAARKPDFDAYIDPQKKHADVILQVRSAARPQGCSFMCHRQP